MLYLFFIETARTTVAVDEDLWKYLLAKSIHDTDRLMSAKRCFISLTTTDFLITVSIVVFLSFIEAPPLLGRGGVLLLIGLAKH